MKRKLILTLFIAILILSVGIPTTLILTSKAGASSVCAKEGHIYENGVCTRCGDNQFVTDSSLVFKQLNDDSYAITGVRKALPENLIIPSTHNGNLIAAIEENAFYNFDMLKSVVIPDGIKTIGDSAFGGCDKLASVKIGNGVTKIGNNAFANCKALTEIEIPESVKR